MYFILQLRLHFFWGFLISITSFLNAQQTLLQGTVIDAITNEPLDKASLHLENTVLKTQTDNSGSFSFEKGLPLGEQILIITKEGYYTSRLPIIINEGQTLLLEHMELRINFDGIQNGIETIMLDEEILDNDIETNTNASALLHASKDIFLKTAAFDWSSTFFRPRGYDGNQGKVLINGVEMNKIYNGRPQWSNWGGLNNVQRNQEFSSGLAPFGIAFGALGGTTSITMRASQYRKGTGLSYGLSNRSYMGRVMGTHHSGVSNNGWAYSFSISRRYGTQGYIEGTSYDANSVFVSVEKQLGTKHHINLVAFYTPNHRGKTSPNTQEVSDLKGSRYNAYWGYQNGVIRNSRIKSVEEPVVMLHHFWKFNDHMQLQTNVAFQKGKVGNTRLHYGGTTRVTDQGGQSAFVGNGSNPDPAYYQNLPSYFLRDTSRPDYENAFLGGHNFRTNGQLPWDALYDANKVNTRLGGNSIYVLQEDRNDDTMLMAGSIFTGNFGDHFALSTSINFRTLKSENFSSVKDLLGGNGFLDIDSFEQGDQAQNDLQHPNRIVGIGDKFQYHYDLTARIGEIFAQGKFEYNFLDFFVSGTTSKTSYQRIGYFENGNAPGKKSLGDSEQPDFMNYGIKAGITLKINGNHFIQTRTAYQTKAPSLRNVFSNPRQNNNILIGIASQRTKAVEANYVYQSSKIKARLSGYYTQFENDSSISFFFTDGISGLGASNTAAFVQETLTDISKKHMGLELGIEVPINSTLKLKGAAAIGEYVYNNNPELYLTSNDFSKPFSLGKSALKNYHISGGPQRAYSLGFEYRDPKYWWIASTANHFSHAHINSSPFTRTRNFFTDTDGLPFSNYDENKAKELLRQERFEAYFLVNIVGGKSWKIKSCYLGCFVGINNVLNTQYKTGGFEQSRNANYNAALEESTRTTPVFGSKYWNGLGTTYFTNFYIRF